METNDTTPDLMRRACEVMGYEILSLAGGDEVVINSEKIQQCFLSDEWNILRLIVEWVDARGGSTSHGHNRQPDMGSKRTWFAVTVNGVQRFSVSSTGITLPLAAARWIVEHGEKIKEVKADV